MKVEYEKFAVHADRAAYAARRYADFLQGAVLDVGCGEAALRDLLTGASYTGVDVAGKPDVQLDIDKAHKWPFGDASFDCVVCTETLEHLEHFHAVFDELFRVARRHVILSLPNCWCAARPPVERGKGKIKHYGLPAQLPGDRHRWFFSIGEALQFLQDKERTLPFRIRDVHAVEKPRALPVRLARRLRWPRQMRYLNRYAESLWALLERK